jgi:hypothetical protein
MPKSKNPLGIKEERLTPEEYEDAIVKYNELPADVVEETEFRKRLKATTIVRYKKASKLVSGVQKRLADLAVERGGASGKELKLAITELDHSIVQMTHASLGFNKGAVAGKRNLLEIKRARGNKKKTV